MKWGVVDSVNPVHVFWILYKEEGQQAELSDIQRKFAYGLTTNKIAENHYELSFLSYKKFIMQLEPGADNKLHVYVNINNRKAILTNIYLEINGGTFWKPNIEFAEITGVDPANNSIVMERIKI